MKTLMTSLLAIGLVGTAFSQKIAATNQYNLDDVEVTAQNTSYLKALNTKHTQDRIAKMNKEVAYFDLSDAEFFDGESTEYNVTFSNTNSFIAATYDADGNIVKAKQRFKNVAPSAKVRNNIYKAYPGWVIDSNVYSVSYDESGRLVKVMKVKLEKDDKHIRLKVDLDGNII